MKETDTATDWREIDRYDRGVGWIAHPDETMQRASHAVEVDGEVWVIDPVDAEGIDDLLAEFGDVAGVVVLLDRHKRDSAAIARRHGVQVWVPSFMDGVADDLDAPVEQFRHDLADTGFAAHEVVNNYVWQEALLYEEDDGVLIVPEAVGTTEYFRVGDRPLGVHPALRLKPPTNLTRLRADRLLVGHGAGIHEDVDATLRDAIDGARTRTPSLYWKNLRMVLSGGD
jgi:hypothetical protein